jgi:hypothetical protein
LKREQCFNFLGFKTFTKEDLKLCLVKIRCTPTYTGLQHLQNISKSFKYNAGRESWYLLKSQ